MSNIKEAIGKPVRKTVSTVGDALNNFSKEVDDNPSMIYWGLCGLAFTIGLMYGDAKSDLNEIKNKLD